MLVAVLLISAYFVGAIPFGYLVAKAKGIDILQFGSGNIGATNVHRALGKWLGLCVFVLDVLKGLAPAGAAYYLLHGSQTWAFVTGMAAVTGHCLSPFLRFKGGKGIATGLGALLGSVPLVALSAFGVFFLGLVITRFVSFSSLVAALTLVAFGFIYHVPRLVDGSLALLTLFVFYRHRANIARLLKGTESRFSLKPGGAADATTGSGVRLLIGVFVACISAILAASAYLQLR